MSAPTDHRVLAGGRKSNRPTYRVTRRGKVVFTAIPLACLLAVAYCSGGSDVLEIEGVTEGQLVSAADLGDLRARVSFDAPVEPEKVSAAVDGTPLDVEIGDGTAAVVDLSGLEEGEHTLTIEQRGTLPLSGRSASVGFSIDATAPGLEVLEPSEPVPPLDPITVRVAVDDAEASYVVDGNPVDPNDDGVIEIEYTRPPSAAVEVRAVDAAGNETSVAVDVVLALAGAPGGPPIRGVHATGYTWVTPELKDPLLAMIAEGRINTVQLDLKDESGDIWYATEVPFASEIGAITELYDLEEAVEELHGLGVRVVGRIVNFRDPRLADWAVANGRMDMVVQDTDGGALGKYGGFANPYSAEVREYNIAVAEEAARAGVDDIMFDYVRRPDENIDLMVFPQQDRSPEDAIVDFLAESRERVNAAGARLSAAVFGVAATRPDEIAQDIPRMSEHVDYIAPMLYPSHWGPGEYGVSNPNAQPYDIIYRSLVDFGEQTQGTGAGLVAWLQDFSLGVDYGESEVRAQIQAAIDAGVPDFLLWDAATTYTVSALDPE